MHKEVYIHTYARMHIILTIDIFRVFLFILFNHPKSLVTFFLNGSTHFVTKDILNHNTDSKCYIKRMGSCSICSIHDCLFSPCEYLLLALGMDMHMHSLTHSTHLLTHSLTPLTHSTHSPTHSIQSTQSTQSTHLLNPITHSIYSPTHPPIHSLIDSLTKTHMHTPTYICTRSCIHLCTHTLTYTYTHSYKQPNY